MKEIAFYRRVWGIPGLYVGGERFRYQTRESGVQQLGGHLQKAPATLTFYLQAVFTDCLPCAWHYLG